MQQPVKASPALRRLFAGAFYWFSLDIIRPAGDCSHFGLCFDCSMQQPVKASPALRPTLVFALIAVCNSLLKLRQPCVNLLKGIVKIKGKTKNTKDKKTFVAEMRSSVLRSRKTLVFFIAFSSFCFSAMIQMSASMKDLSSEMMGLMMLIIGVVLAFTTLGVYHAVYCRDHCHSLQPKEYCYDACIRL